MTEYQNLTLQLLEEARKYIRRPVPIPTALYLKNKRYPIFFTIPDDLFELSAIQGKWHSFYTTKVDELRYRKPCNLLWL